MCLLHVSTSELSLLKEMSDEKEANPPDNVGGICPELTKRRHAFLEVQANRKKESNKLRACG